MKQYKNEISVIKYFDEISSQDQAEVSIEAPLEIFIDGGPYYLTMRLPGDEVPLALGYCFSEGIIESNRDVQYIRHCRQEGGNRVEISLDPGRKMQVRPVKEKIMPAFSSCGICGNDMIDDTNRKLPRRDVSFSLSVSDIKKMHNALSENQAVYRDTRCTHAAAVFNRECSIISFAEDLGRHNALDKAIGRLVAWDAVKRAAIVMLTSRLSFEMIRKAGCLATEIIIGISAPSSMAIELAKSLGITLIGFSADGKGIIYTFPERVLFLGSNNGSGLPSGRINGQAFYQAGLNL